MHNRSLGSRGLVFGGIMAGLVVVCALIPFLSVFIPIPLVLAYVRFGGKVATLTAVVSGLLTAMFLGPVQAFIVTVPAGILPGLIFGFGFRRKLKPMTIGLLAVAVFFLGFAADYVVTRAAVMGGRDPFVVALESPQGREVMDKMLGSIEQLAQAQGAAGSAQAEQFKAMFAEYHKDPIAFTWSVLPMGLFLIGAASTWINYMLCRWILPRFGHEVPRPAPFSEFRIPTWTVWFFALVMFGSGYVGTSVLNAPWWAKLILNVAGPLTYVFMFAGVAAVYGYLRRKQNMAKGSAVALSLVPLLFGGFGPQIYVLVAMWDTIFDFRGLGHGIMRNRPEGTP
jgi:uncharacterized protein YybS (DUF2232 family)